MSSTLFSTKDFKQEQLNSFYLNIPQLEEKKKIIANWQKAIANGKVQKSKEEQIKGEFLDKFFGQVLGYNYESHEAEWNLEKEFKSIADNKKPDAALGFFNQTDKADVRCVIEVKGALNNLDKKQNRADFTGSPVDQAFAYVPRMPGKCEWVIVTNMIEIRLYSRTDIGRYESFQIPELLLEKNITRFFFLLSYQQLFLEKGDSKIDQIFHNRVAEQKVIEKEFYNRYHELRVSLFNNLRKQHPEIAPKKLFGLTQKLLDRLLFICFVRDRELLNANQFLSDVQQAVKRSFRKKKEAIWTEMKYFFTAMNEGLSESERNIPEFNGGLFKEDEDLNNLHVHDSQLIEIINFVSSYNFDSQLDVNILGHIFEQSISDIEQFQQTFDEESEKAAHDSKRKKDGIFYTPEYITRYMVKEAVGGWLDDRKKEILQDLQLEFLPVLSADEIENATTTPSEKVKITIAFLERYREQLKKVKVVDPACGSGAFLNAVFDFLWLEWDVLMKEWNQLNRPWKDQLRDHLVAEPFGVYNGIDEWKIKKSIVANNIYGVDLNPESVEISKLSLWLKTANRKETLADLSANIKQGNSLIDDTTVAGDDAFDWNKSFPTIMQAGGFDVVVGNPPYGIQISKGETDYFKEFYPNTNYKTNLYVLFIERMFQLFANTTVHFIIPKSLLFNTYFSKIREILLKESSVEEVFTLGEKIFKDAEVGDSLLIRFKIEDRDVAKHKITLKYAESFQSYLDGKLIQNKIEQIKFLSVANNEISINDEKSNSIQSKLKGLATIQDFFDLKNGLNPGNVKHILIADSAKNKNYRKIIWGRDLNRYSINWSGDFINYDLTLKEKISIDEVKSKEGMNKQKKIDFALRTPDIFETQKICVRKTGDELICSLDNDNYYFDTLINGIYPRKESYNLKFLLGILNSKIATYIYRLLHDIKGKVFAKIILENLASFPIPKKVSSEIQNSLVQQVELMLEISNAKAKHSQNFLNLLHANFKFEPTAKLKKWHTLEFIDVIAELEKGGAKLPPKKQGEWLELFKQEKEKIKNIQSEIDKTDKAIDQLVYALYELTPEEIAIVEGK
jgi:hypothetical protein